MILYQPINVQLTVVMSQLGFPVNENNSYYVGLGYTYNKISNFAYEYNRDLYMKSMNLTGNSIKTNDLISHWLELQQPKPWLFPN